MKVEQVIGARIAQVRERQGITQTELGKRLEKWLGRSWLPQAVWSAEQGKRAFTAAELVAFAQLLEVSVSYFFTPSLNVKKVEMPSGVKLDRTALAEATLPSDAVGEVFRDMEEALADLVSDLSQAQDRAATLGVQIDQARQLSNTKGS